MATTSIIKFIRPSRAIGSLIGVNVIISVMIWIADALGIGSDVPGHSMADMLTLPPSWSGLGQHPWTLVTYMFTQVSVLHLIFNMLWLYCFGVYLERILSTIRIWGIYMAGGVCGGLLYILTRTEVYTSTPHLVGASASVIAVITVAACRLSTLRVRLILLGEVRLLWVAIGALIICFAEGGFRNPSIPAHAGGLIAGVIYGLSDRAWSERWRHLMHRVRLRLYSSRRREMFTGNPADRSISASRGRAENRARLDQLLDKIRVSGYASLSREEKDELNLLSRNL
ncbi:MAG: rhomboid family intramembrane serine protease [Muribaculaceae bacterium]|nr:rhomboid family intramembrane serine protease [Muribaculaceae bacterium]